MIKVIAAAARPAHLRHLSHCAALKIHQTSSSELLSRSRLPAEQQCHPRRQSQWYMLPSTCFQGSRSADLWTRWQCPVWLRCILPRGDRCSSTTGTCDPCLVWEARRRSAIIQMLAGPDKTNSMFAFSDHGTGLLMVASLLHIWLQTRIPN